MELELWENIFSFFGTMLGIRGICYEVVLMICAQKYKKEIKRTIRQERKYGNRKKAKELLVQAKEQFRYFYVESIKVLVFPIAKLFLYSIEDYLNVVCMIPTKNTILPLVIAVIGCGLSFLYQMMISKMCMLIVKYRNSQTILEG